jgi:hypothetical protein
MAKDPKDVTDQEINNELSEGGPVFPPEPRGLWPTIQHYMHRLWLKIRQWMRG